VTAPEPRAACVPATVWHIGAWNRNVGDWALAYQLHRMLNEEAHARGLHLSYHLVDSQRTWFHPALIDQINEEADLVIVGGGGLVFFRPEDRSVSGWSFNIAPADLARIAPPIAVYAVGFNRFAFDSSSFPGETGPHLRQLQRQAKLFSVRNEGTRRILAQEYGLDADRIEVVPDPGIRLFDRPLVVPARRRTGPVIAVNWAGDRPHFRYPAPAEENAALFAARLKQALLRAVDELGAQIMFLPHLAGIDTDVFDDFAADFPTGSIFSTHRELAFLYPPAGEMLYAHVPFFTNLFRQADLVLGMRFHSCVLAFGARTPFIRLGSHPKLRYLLEETQVPDYSIAMLDRSVETVDWMFRRIAGALSDTSFRPILAASHARQLATMSEFNRRVVSLVETGVRASTVAV
jgi:polysaccharide pyruvyl transferase WcaK-like protein